MSLLRCVEVAEELQDVSDLDLRAPLLAFVAGVEICALKARAVVLLNCLVALLLGGGSKPQIGNGVVQRISVYVVNCKWNFSSGLINF